MFKTAKGLWTLGIAAICLGALVYVAVAFGQPGPTVSAETTGDQAHTEQAAQLKPFLIKVISSKTGLGVPLVEFATLNGIKHYTDSAGLIAFLEPGLMDQTVFFRIGSDGYQFSKEVDGIAGQSVDITPGGQITLEIDPVNIAERLYRITGQGIYRDSTLLGLDTPLENPNLAGRVVGSDSAQVIPYNGKIYWFWGDTGGPFHILGNFRTTGATSLLPEDGGLAPEVGVNLDYFTQDNGFVKKMVPPLSDNAGLVWVSGMMTVPDPNREGKETLLTGYASLNGLSSLVARGILQFDDEKQEFKRLVEFKDLNDWRIPGTATYYEDNGQGYYLFARPWVNVRVKADFYAIQDPEQYEAFTCLKPGAVFDGSRTEVERDQDGKLVWDWKLNTAPLTQEQEKDLLMYGVIKPEEARFQLKDVDTGADVQIHASSVNWNEHLQSWILIGQQIYGSSFLGEIWFAEAPTPTGPWNWARKIVTHKAYSFYNPIQHAFFDQEGGRIIYFESTYTAGFTNEIRTPNYDYNQMMFRLDLDDPDLGLPLQPKK